MDFALYKQAAHKKLEEFFDALEAAMTAVEQAAEHKPSSSRPPRTMEAPDRTEDLEKAIYAALAVAGRRSPKTQVRPVDELDRAVVLAVRTRTNNEDWPDVSRRLQANLKLTRQQVAGIVAAASRNGV